MERVSVPLVIVGAAVARVHALREFFSQHGGQLPGQGGLVQALFDASHQQGAGQADLVMRAGQGGQQATFILTYGDPVLRMAYSASANTAVSVTPGRRQSTAAAMPCSRKAQARCIRMSSSSLFTDRTR